MARKGPRRLWKEKRTRAVLQALYAKEYTAYELLARSMRA